jgi:hypothetical protein
MTYKEACYRAGGSSGDGRFSQDGMVKAGHAGGFLRRLSKTTRTNLGLDANGELRLRIMSATSTSQNSASL